MANFFEEVMTSSHKPISHPLHFCSGLLSQIFADLEAHPRTKPSGMQLKDSVDPSTAQKFKSECCEGV